MGIGFGVSCYYIIVLFYISIKAYEVRTGKASALCEGGLSKGKKYLAFVVSPNKRKL